MRPISSANFVLNSQRRRFVCSCSYFARLPVPGRYCAFGLVVCTLVEAQLVSPSASCASERTGPACVVCTLVEARPCTHSIRCPGLERRQEPKCLEPRWSHVPRECCLRNLPRVRARRGRECGTQIGWRLVLCVGLCWRYVGQGPEYSLGAGQDPLPRPPVRALHGTSSMNVFGRGPTHTWHKF